VTAHATARTNFKIRNNVKRDNCGNLHFSFFLRRYSDTIFSNWGWLELKSIHEHQLVTGPVPAWGGVNRTLMDNLSLLLTGALVPDRF
jgi:hypothetical protein